VLEIDSVNARALHYRGVSSSQSGDLEAGLVDFARAIALDPSYAPAHGGRATARRLLDDTEGALADLERAIQVQPQNGVLYHARGCLFYDTRDWDLALADFRRAIELDPNDQALAQARVWLVRARLGGSDAASVDLARFVDGEDARTVDGWEREIVLFLLGRRSERQLFEGVTTEEPWITAGRRTQANFYAGSLRLLHGDRAGAIRFFEVAVAQNRGSFSEHLSALQDLREIQPSLQ
jgi:lipoprotein NlpI